VSIKRLPPEAVETFSILLHPKRTYSVRRFIAATPNLEDMLLTEGGEDLMTEGGEDILLET
jgi:hypothetical protein